MDSCKPIFSLIIYKITLVGNFINRFSIKLPFKCNSKEKIKDPIIIDLNLENLVSSKLKKGP